MSFWEDFAGNDEAWPEDRQPDDLPANSWAIGRTCTEENGGAGPAVRLGGNEQNPFYAFKVGLICEGGDGNIERKRHEGRYTFYEASLNEKDKPETPSGRLVGFATAVLACGVGGEVPAGASRDVKQAHEAATKIARRRALAAAFDEAAQREGLSLDLYNGNLPKFFAACLVAALKGQSYPVLYKTQEQKNKEGKVTGVRVGSVEDATAANFAKRKAARFDAATVDKEF